MFRHLWPLLIWSALTAGCTPTLDWREVRPEGTDLVALFPCKPADEVRTVPLDSQRLQMSMSACKAADATFVLSHVEVADPARVGAVITGLMAANRQNIGAGDERAPVPFSVPGMTPHSRTGQARIAGRLPDGRPIELAVASFVRGTHVFQASVVASKLDQTAVETYFSSLKFGG